MATQQSSPAPATIPGTKSNYLMEMLTELKKTTWPTKQEAVRLTSLVLAVIVALSIYMGILDWLLTLIVQKTGLLK